MLAELVEASLKESTGDPRVILARWRRAVRVSGATYRVEREWLAWLAARETLLRVPLRPVQKIASKRKIQPTRETGEASETNKTRKSQEARDFCNTRDPRHANPTRTTEYRPRPSTTLDAAPEPVEPIDPIYVSNAGIVVLWPFLPRYFDILGLTRESTFIDFDARSRAVHLLHWLGSGQLARHEADLPLAKLLCGVTIGLPLAPGAERELDAHELSVSAQVLAGVRQNWDKLRNTSVEGLRETFLMREGRLMPPQDPASPTWQLTVEPKVFDVLLITLPWGLSTIRLSWMEAVLAVQWHK